MPEVARRLDRTLDSVTAQTILTSVTQAGQLESYIYVPAEKAGQAKAGMKLEIVNIPALAA